MPVSIDRRQGTREYDPFAVRLPTRRKIGSIFFAPKELYFGVMERRGLGRLGDVDDPSTWTYDEGYGQGKGMGAAWGGTDQATGVPSNPWNTKYMPEDASGSGTLGYRNGYFDGYTAVYPPKAAGGGAGPTPPPKPKPATPVVVTPGPGPGPGPAPAPEEDNTLLYVGAGVVGLAVVGGVIYLVARKRRHSVRARARKSSRRSRRGR